MEACQNPPTDIWLGIRFKTRIERRKYDIRADSKTKPREQYVYPDVFTDKCGLDIILSNDKLHAVRSWGYTKR